MAVKKSGILLYAKKAGCTSFSSLYDIKKALGTSKVGHTGTLDSFADGLLVVLSGNLTRLVPHITSFDKSYKAVFVFGEQTDTLDPTGSVCTTADLPSFEKLKSILPLFTGVIQQTPPDFSAVHINGRRASEIARIGGAVNIPSREITVSSISIDSVHLEDGLVRYALFSVSCSKGTYIRSLARDIAAACGSCAHVGALRRTRVGPFLLEDSVGVQDLPSFSIKQYIENVLNHFPVSEIQPQYENIRQKCSSFTKETAVLCGLSTVELSAEFVKDFQNGKKLSFNMFTSLSADIENLQQKEYAVFTPSGFFSGVISVNKKNILYQYVIPGDDCSESL